MSAAVATAASTPPEPKNENEILSIYRQMTSEMRGLIQNLTKMEIELNEHRYVIILLLYLCIILGCDYVICL